jgi:hypothetical protein
MAGNAQRPPDLKCLLKNHSYLVPPGGQNKIKPVVPADPPPMQIGPCPRPVPKLCQNPIYLKCFELLLEREQVPQVVDIRHFRMELMESLEPANILRNQQVAGSIPAGGSSFS